jgi:serine/threonine-protein kinase
VSAPRHVRAGDALGRYEIGEELGEGGMATVFRARDRELRRDVAVKVLFPHLAKKPEIVRRFQREARAAAGLDHANILRIYDVGGGEGDDPPYIVMELIRGRTLLAEIEQRGAMLTEVVACVGALLADATAAAHAAGIIHRDIKPANVLVAPGRLLLADFGVARLETEDSLVTRTGALLGTPAYMSPEQATGDTATARSDVYSLGATMYQLSTGSLPYGGAPAKMIAAVAEGKMVPPVRRRPAVGAELSRAIERMMAVEAEARPASAAAVAAELRALAAAGGFGDAGDEWTAYVADPAAFVAAKVPVVVKALVASARAAVADGKLPRAMALADRASALAPDDAQVAALVASITAGGRASRRARVIGVVAAGVLVVGGGVGAAWKLASRGSSGADASLAVTLDASVVAATDGALAPDAPVALAPPDALAVVALAPPDAAAVALVAPDGSLVAAADAVVALAPPDAVAVAFVATDAPRAHHDARVVAAAAMPDAPAAVPMATPDAPVAPDAALAAASLPIDAPPAPLAAPGAILVDNDVWCDIAIDDLPRGRTLRVPLAVPAGRHVVRCSQPSRGEWHLVVDVAPGKTVAARGTLLADVVVTNPTGFAVTLGGAQLPPNGALRLRPGRFEVIRGSEHKFIDVRASCHLSPSLDCDL